VSYRRSSNYSAKQALRPSGQSRPAKQSGSTGLKPNTRQSQTAQEPSQEQQQSTILSVSELNQFARGTLEMHVGKVWVSGEVSNLSTPASGHWYFTLKDDQAQVRCAMFRGKNQFIRTRLAPGMQIIVNGNVSLYEGRGDYQLIADYLEESGVGAMARAFEALKQKLKQEGLFDQRYKKPLPKHLKHLVVITSDTGAAIHDITSVLKERFPALRITLIPAAVQGEGAPKALIHALHLAEQFHQDDAIDAVIIGRGGGSSEDLWAFNNEALARSIFQFSLPIISAVGHEVDISIADLVADVRAPTPSAAAEMISPDQAYFHQLLDHSEQRLSQCMQKMLGEKQQALSLLEKQLKHPSDTIKRYQQQFAASEHRLQQSILNQLASKRLKLNALQERQRSPQQKLDQQQQQLNTLNDKLMQQMKQRLQQLKQDLAHSASELELVSPLATLQRGYSIIKDEQGKIIKHSDKLKPGQIIQGQLAKGSFKASIESCE